MIINEWINMEWRITNNSLYRVFSEEKIIVSRRKVEDRSAGRKKGCIAPHTV